MEHTEWQSDAPVPSEDEVDHWVAPAWMINSVIAGVVLYLVVGVIMAIFYAPNRAQVSGLMVPISFLFEVFLWPLPLILPSLHFQTV